MMETAYVQHGSDEGLVSREGNACDMDVSNDFNRQNETSQSNNNDFGQNNGQSEAIKPWWLDADSATVAASYKASQAQFAKLKDLCKDLIQLNDSEDEESIQVIESHKQSTIQNLNKLRPGLTAQDELNVWSKIFGVPPESVTRVSDPLINTPSANGHPSERPKSRYPAKPPVRMARTSPVRRVNYSPVEEDMMMSREQSPTEVVRYPRCTRPIVLSDEQVRNMIQRMNDDPRPLKAEHQLNQKFQKIIRHGQFFANPTINEKLGLYLSSFATLTDAFKQSMSIFWDNQTLQSHTIPSKIDSLDLKPDQILPIIPLQHEFWTYWNAVTDEKNMSSGQRHSLMTIVGLVNSKHNKNVSRPPRSRSSIPADNYYEYEVREDSPSHNNLNRVSSSHIRSPRMTMNSAQTSTRDPFMESMHSRAKIISQRPSPHRSVSSGSSTRPSGSLPRTSYPNSSPQQQQASNNHKFSSYPINGSSPNTSSDVTNHAGMSNSNKASRSVSSSKGVGREVGRAFDSLFADRIEEMLATCSTLFKPMSAQPKAESWLSADAIERMNNLQFFSDMGLNISVGAIILSQGTIGAAVRAIAIVFWGHNTLSNQKVMKPASKFNMSPANPSGLPGETAFHSLWNCILQFERDDNIYERYLRAVNYIAETMKREQLAARSYSDY